MLFLQLSTKKGFFSCSKKGYNVIILIDGYNLLKQLFPKLKENLDKQKDQLIKQLGYYKQKKLPDIKDIILIFDGGQQRHATRETHKGIVVIYAGQNITADEWILDFATKNREKEMLLITLDKKLILSCQKYGVDSLNIFDFYKILQNTLIDNAEINNETGKINVQKFKDSEAQAEYNTQIIDNKALDLLMEQASLTFGREKEDDIYTEKNAREGKAKKISKQEKKVYKKLKKL